MANKPIHQHLIEHSPIAFGYHKVLYDDQQKPVDYTFIEVNEAFEKMTGLKRKQLLNQPITKVLPKIIDDPFDWIAFYGEIAAKKLNKTFEAYSKPLKRWYRIKAYSVEEGFFATTFIDITEEKAYIKALHDITVESNQFIEHDFNKAIDYQEIANTIKILSKARFAAINVYDEKGEYFITKAVSGNRKAISRALKLIGIDLKETKWDHDETRAEKIKDQTTTRFAHLGELISDVIAPSLVKLLLKTFDIGEVVVVKITKDGKMLGDFTLLMSKADTFNQTQPVELYANLIGIVIDRERVQKKYTKLLQYLKTSEQTYRLLAHNIADVVWTTDLDFNITWVSPSAERLLENPPSAYINTSLYQWIHKSQRPIVDKALRKLKAEKSKDATVEIEIPVKKKDGSILYVAMKMTHLIDDDNQPIGIHGVTRDITTRVEKERQIETQNKNQQTILNALEYLKQATLDNVEKAMHKALEEVAQITVADRVYVFEHDYKNRLTNNTYEWCAEGIKPEIDNLQKIPFSEFQLWFDYHENEEPVIIDDVFALPQNDSVRKILEPQGIKSLIVNPLYNEGQLFGFIGFDSVVKKHSYPKDEEQLLQQFGHYVVATLKQIGYMKQLQKSEQAIQQEKQLFETTLLSVGDGIISTDPKGNILILNPVAEQLTGFNQNEALGKPLEEILFLKHEFTQEPLPNPAKSVMAAKSTMVLSGDTILTSKDGIERPIELSSAPIKDKHNQITGVVLVFKDYTDKKKHLDEIEYLSMHDHLTGLYNRRYLDEKLKALDTKANLPLSLVVADLNGLKLINDAFGHNTGDELLKKTAETFKSVFRKSDIIARVGGDEVGVIMPKTSAEEAKKIIDKYYKSIKQKRVMGLDISVSFGSKTKTKASQDTDLILKKAEDAMYNHKLFEKPNIQASIIENILKNLYAKSPNEALHAKNVAKYSVALGKALNLKNHDIELLEKLGHYHDIGKIAISESILNKATPLNANEETLVKRHSEIGYRILNATEGTVDIAHAVLYHHERWDGSGYPKGIKKVDIPILSRICSIAEVYDAMTGPKNYKQPKPKAQAKKEMQDLAGIKFDPELVKVFFEDVLPKL